MSKKSGRTLFLPENAICTTKKLTWSPRRVGNFLPLAAKAHKLASNPRCVNVRFFSSAALRENNVSNLMGCGQYQKLLENMCFHCIHDNLIDRKTFIFSHCESKAGFRPCQLLCVLKNPLKVKLQKGPFLPEVYYLLLFHFKNPYSFYYIHSYCCVK